MNDQELRRYCTRLVEELDLPAGAGANALCDLIEERRGRPISLLEIPMPTGPGRPCGLWVATDEVDYIGYQKWTTRAHQEHIIRHEIGHILCGHESARVMPDDVAQLLMPTLSPDLVRSVLGRTQYSNGEERAAEAVASLMSLRANAVGHRQTPDLSPGMANLVSHLGRSLERGTRG